MEVGAELFIKLKNGGIDALWEELKEEGALATDEPFIQAVAMDAIRDTNSEGAEEFAGFCVVEAGIKWIMGLLSPAGAFIKAAMMVIDIVTFFVERAASIIDLVMAFIDGIRAQNREIVAVNPTATSAPSPTPSRRPSPRPSPS